MKKGLGIVLASLLIAVSIVALADDLGNMGLWSVQAYVDEFNMPTDEYYVVSKPLAGTFSDSVATNEDLTAYVFHGFSENQTMVWFRLFTYGNFAVKNNRSESVEYEILMRDTNGEDHSFIGYMPPDSMNLYVNTDYHDKSLTTTITSTDAIDVRNELYLHEGTVRFAITQKDNKLYNYIFSISNTAGFKKATDIMTERREASQWEEFLDESQISVGTKIQHTEYGIGTVTAINKWSNRFLITVDFEGQGTMEFDFNIAHKNGFIQAIQNSN